jgi:hypothetical protein
VSGEHVPIGGRLDALGLLAGIADSQHITAALVILKVVDTTEDGMEPNLIIATDPGTDWIDERGLLGCAQEIFQQVRAERMED